MRIAVLLLAVVAARGSITNECAVIRVDGSTRPCVTSDVTYQEIRWGDTLTFDDAYLEVKIGYTQSLMFTGVPAGTKGYMAIYAYDFLSHYSPSGGDVFQLMRSNLPLTKTMDDTSQFIEPDPATFIPITFGTPIDFRVSLWDTEAGHYPENQYIANWFRVLQINVYDQTGKYLWAEFPGPTTEYAEMQVPVHAPEPASIGITGAGVLAFLVVSRRYRRISRG